MKVLLFVVLSQIDPYQSLWFVALSQISSRLRPGSGDRIGSLIPFEIAFHLLLGRQIARCCFLPVSGISNWVVTGPRPKN